MRLQHARLRIAACAAACLLVAGGGRGAHGQSAGPEAGTSRRIRYSGPIILGLRPDDPALEPYWHLAEELDVPVMVHLGTSFPGTAHSGYPAFRLSLGNPLLLEEVLVRHPGPRVWVAHGGLLWSDAIFARVQQYPQLYIDIATINWIGGRAERAAFHSFLRQAIQHGLGKRIMFGSDQMAWPDAIGLAIESVDSADFLTPQQKHDISYASAARFLRLGEELDQP